MIEVRKLHKKYFKVHKQSRPKLIINYNCCQCNKKYSEIYEIKLQNIYTMICNDCLLKLLLELNKVGFVFRK